MDQAKRSWHGSGWSGVNTPSPKRSEPLVWAPWKTIDSSSFETWGPTRPPNNGQRLGPVCAAYSEGTTHIWVCPNLPVTVRFNKRYTEQGLQLNHHHPLAPGHGIDLGPIGRVPKNRPGFGCWRQLAQRQGLVLWHATDSRGWNLPHCS